MVSSFMRPSAFQIDRVPLFRNGHNPGSPKRCRTLREFMHHGLGETASREASPESKAHYRPEAVCGRTPHEVNAGPGRLETRREHRCAIDRFELRAYFC